MKADKINPDVAWVPLDSLAPWARNARQHTTDSTAKLSAGIRRFGFPVPITAWKSERRIAAGHGRRLAMQALLAEDPSFVPRNAPPGTAPGLVPVMWTEFASEAQFEAFALSDNRQAKNAEDDELLMAAVLADLDSQGIDFDGMGFDAGEIDALLEQLDNESAGVDQSEADDDVPDLQDEVHSVLGEVYQLGPHRLVCGDSTDQATWDRLLEGDSVPKMMWTDPPYGIAYKAVKRKDMHRAIEGDGTMVDAQSTLDGVLACLPKGVEAAFLCCDWKCFGMMRDALQAIDRPMKELLIWDKKNRCHNLLRYAKVYEMIIYSGPFGGQPTLADNIWRVAREFRLDHPTPKPVELVAMAITTCSNAGELVIDPFAGSGSCVIAAGVTGRKARVIELDPRYCDVIRRRWTKWADAHGVDPGPGALDPGDVEK